MLKDEQIYKNVAQKLRQKAGLVELRKRELFADYGEAAFTGNLDRKSIFCRKLDEANRVIKNYMNAANLVEKLGEREQTDLD